MFISFSVFSIDTRTQNVIAYSLMAQNIDTPFHSFMSLMDYPLEMTDKRQVSWRISFWPRLIFAYLTKFLGLFIVLFDFPVLRIYWKRLIFTYVRFLNILMSLAVLYSQLKNTQISLIIFLIFNCLVITYSRIVTWKNSLLNALVFVCSFYALLHLI